MRAHVFVAAVLSLFTSMELAALDFDNPVTKETIAARLAELTPPDKGVPEDLIGLNDERQSLAGEISRLRTFMQEGKDYAKEIAAIDKAKIAASAAFSDFSQIGDCKTAGDAQADVIFRLTRPIGAVNKIAFFNDLETIENPWAEAPRFSDQIKPQDICARWKTFLGLKGRQETLLTYFDSLKSALSDITKKYVETKSQANTLTEVLQKRREIVEGRLAKKATQDTLTDKFWVALLVIGIFSVGTILAVKLFTPEIQLEWVASGQVIQFVTVMILLSVVMALGLAGILKENTLGTLLGGIAGYVLAQGVGRAAAREVSRGQARPPSGTD